MMDVCKATKVLKLCTLLSMQCMLTSMLVRDLVLLLQTAIRTSRGSLMWGCLLSMKEVILPQQMHMRR